VNDALPASHCCGQAMVVNVFALREPCLMATLWRRRTGLRLRCGGLRLVIEGFNLGICKNSSSFPKNSSGSVVSL
ncbi:hypothetical protein VIGAN_04136000, partial [Vigna angularis var. angularis]